MKKHLCIPLICLFPAGFARGLLASGRDYQRTYRVDGKDYPHIIDPQTGMPEMLWIGKAGDLFTTENLS